MTAVSQLLLPTLVTWPRRAPSDLADSSALDSPSQRRAFEPVPHARPNSPSVHEPTADVPHSVASTFYHGHPHHLQQPLFARLAPRIGGIDPDRLSQGFLFLCKRDVAGCAARPQCEHPGFGPAGTGPQALPGSEKSRRRQLAQAHAMSPERHKIQASVPSAHDFQAQHTATRTTQKAFLRSHPLGS